MRHVTAGIALIAVALAMSTGCGAHRMPPVDPRTTEGLRPSVEDVDAGLVTAVQGLRLKDYSMLVVRPFSVDQNEIKDEEDARLARDMAAHLQTQLLKYLARPDIPRVVDGRTSSEAPARNVRALRLEGDISKLTEGNRALRYLVGFGAGAAKAQIETRLIDAASGNVLLVTADRRAAAMGLFGGDGREFVTDSMDQMAEGLAKLLQRLGRGGRPGGAPGVRDRR